MSTLINDEERRMVPRWRSSIDAAALGETAPFKARSETPDAETSDPLLKLKQDWQTRRGIAYANDLISAAIAMQRPEEASDAARFILEHSDETTRSAAELANTVLHQGWGRKPYAPVLTTAEQAAANTKRLRYTLSRWPDNPVGWTDLARNLTILGSHEKAERAMRVALGLAPNHRFTLRAGARFFQIYQEPERALALLRGRDVTSEDPWLLSAEIALSRIVGRQPLSVRKARELLSNDRLHPFHTSELAASLATLDFESGSDRQAKKRFSLALRSPTENTVAQASWAERHRLNLGLSDDLARRPSAHEALAWQAYLAGGWEVASAAAWQWLADEPFSSRPARFGSYLSAVVLARYPEAIQFSEIALRAKPRQFGLLNNIAFSYASNNDPVQAKHYLERVQVDGLKPRERIVLTGTYGLVEYRSGNVARGRQLYSRAVSEARRQGDDNLLVSALVFFAREEAGLNGHLFEELLSEAVKTQERANEISLQPLIDELDKVRNGNLFLPKR